MGYARRAGDVSNVTLTEFISSLPVDDNSVIANIEKILHEGLEMIELFSEIPARVDVDIIIGKVNRWSEVARYFNCPVRVYGWCYDNKVEEYITSVVNSRSDVFITLLPYTLKGL